jgi:protein SCO1
MTIKKKRTVIWAINGVALLAIVAFFIFQPANEKNASILQAGSKIGAPFELIDHFGQPITEAAMTGQPTIVFFGFTHCPDVCPTTLLETATWLAELGEDGKTIQPFFITVDPERDTPEIMKAYVENFSDRVTGITGDPDKIAKLAQAWHVYNKKVPLDGGGYTMDHTASVFLVDSEGNFRGTIAFGEDSDAALAKLKRLATL